MVGWHHRLDGRQFEHTPGDGEGQGGLVCCSPRGHKESDTTERLKNNNKPLVIFLITSTAFTVQFSSVAQSSDSL